VIDLDGYRANVGIILNNQDVKLLRARRIGQEAWQYPQVGIQPNESPEDAMYRELREEVGLVPCHVNILGRTSDWLRYRLPKGLIRHQNKPVCIGQKQIWFLLELKGDESDVRLDVSDEPEFDHWRWIDYWAPLDEVVSFKRGVYEHALAELEPLVIARGAC